ncbi:HD domain-containing protein [Oceanobacillus manasiensis]|uniref:HD domain-containing protein n=1 Tax=Oceanobacillus manasiensis TaxID=586413 RepID=UPI0005A93DB8|nr:HD domain-containing protein [Oceanobacillus manasiensis]
MDKHKQLSAIREYVKALFINERTGHDLYHLQRVTHTAKLIACEEDANLFLSEAIAWLHDTTDHKLVESEEQAKITLRKFLDSILLSESEIEEILEAITTISFSKEEEPSTLEGKIVQDADRLDAMGAIGIARAFTYGGAKKRFMYHEEEKDHTIQHFYDKLLKLKSTMHTASARTIAEERHLFMQQFLDQFYKEWN